MFNILDVKNINDLSPKVIQALKDEMLRGDFSIKKQLHLISLVADSTSSKELADVDDLYNTLTPSEKRQVNLNYWDNELGDLVEPKKEKPYRSSGGGTEFYN